MVRDDPIDSGRASNCFGALGLISGHEPHLMNTSVAEPGDHVRCIFPGLIDDHDHARQAIVDPNHDARVTGIWRHPAVEHGDRIFAIAAGNPLRLPGGHDATVDATRMPRPGSSWTSVGVASATPIA